MRSLQSMVNLVVCQKSKINDWVDHFKTHYPQYKVFNLTNKRELAQFHALAMGFQWSVVGVINYELAWRRKELLDLYDFTLMLDESSLIQNRKAKQTKFILRMLPKNVILLSGTPCSGKYENLWTQGRLLGLDISERLYLSQYVNMVSQRVPGGMTIKVVDRKNPYKNVERLKEKFREYGSVFMKTEECFNLPEQTFIDVNIPASSDYKKFIKNGIVILDGEEIIGDTTLTKRLRSRQLCGHLNEDKLQAFKDILESTNDRLIVFYTFTGDFNVLFRICDDYGRKCSVVNGFVKDLSAYEELEDSVTFVQYQAGAMGLNLQKANKIVYFTPTERCDHYLQSMKRTHRIGQEKPCFYYRLICSGSVEEKIYEALERGEDFTNDLFLEGCC